MLYWPKARAGYWFQGITWYEKVTVSKLLNFPTYRSWGISVFYVWSEIKCRSNPNGHVKLEYHADHRILCSYQLCKLLKIPTCLHACFGVVELCFWLILSEKRTFWVPSYLHLSNPLTERAFWINTLWFLSFLCKYKVCNLLYVKLLSLRI